jgi:hypothetical protein
MQTVSPRDMAEQLQVPPSRIRAWLRRKQQDNDPRLAKHATGQRWRLPLDLADRLMREYLADTVGEVPYVRGPHGWLNWRAHLAGRPQRDSTGEGVILRPSWTEYALYSDAHITGAALAGPFTLLLAMGGPKSEVGRSSLQLVLRAHDHLPEPDFPAFDPGVEDVADYYGGDIGDEFAALLSLILGCRLRSGGVLRQAFAGRDPLGQPWEALHDPPTLISPRQETMLPGIAGGVSLAEAEELLSTYPHLQGEDAVVLVRAAQQYADGLWLADADPQLAWITLVSAVETAASRWKSATFPTPVEQLRSHRPKVYRALRDGPRDVLEQVADDLAHTFNAEHKFKQFLEIFDPGPPGVRPVGAQVDWENLKDALITVYHWRSRALHGGLPFPAPLCEPPPVVSGEAHMERFGLIAAAGSGGSWPADKLPMYLHVFAHLVRGALTNWWTSMAEPKPVAR